MEIKTTLSFSFMQVKKKIPIFLFVWVSTQLNAQSFALIQDAEGFVNVRSKPEFKNNVNDTLATGRVVWCFEKEGEWYSVDYYRKGVFRNGYIHWSRLKMISSFQKIPVKKENTDQIVFQKDSVQVTITLKNFVASENKLEYATDSGVKQLAKINGKEPWGTDGRVPKKQYKAIAFTLGERTNSIPANKFSDLFEPHFLFTHVFYDKNSDTLYISTNNSDGAGGYSLLFIIHKGQYKDRMVTFGF